MPKYLLIGRHALTETQKRLLEAAGLTEEAERIQQLEKPEDAIRAAKEAGAEAIVVQALPLHLLAQLLQAASREGIRVYSFRARALDIADTREEAEEKAKRLGADILSPSREGKWRISRTEALQLVKRITIETEDVVRA